MLNTEFGGNSDVLVSTENYDASAAITSSPLSAAVDADDVTVTSPVDGDVERTATKKKTRKKRKSSGKSDAAEEETTSEQVGKGLSHRFSFFSNFSGAYNSRFAIYRRQHLRIGRARTSGGSRKNIWGAWPLIIWEATTAKRNYYRTN